MSCGETARLRPMSSGEGPALGRSFQSHTGGRQSRPEKLRGGARRKEPRSHVFHELLQTSGNQHLQKTSLDSGSRLVHTDGGWTAVLISKPLCPPIGQPLCAQ
jgi:hypothetical protein